MIGTSFAHYEIINHLGPADMGEDYPATDVRLRGSVAIKLLLEAFTNDPARAGRNWTR